MSNCGWYIQCVDGPGNSESCDQHGWSHALIMGLRCRIIEYIVQATYCNNNLASYAKSDTDTTSKVLHQCDGKRIGVHENRRGRKLGESYVYSTISQVPLRTIYDVNVRSGQENVEYTWRWEAQKESNSRIRVPLRLPPHDRTARYTSYDQWCTCDNAIRVIITTLSSNLRVC